MKVSGTAGPTSAGGVVGARAAGLSAAPGGFQPAASPSASDVQGPMGASSVNAVGSLDVLMALQEVGGPLERKRRAVGRAGVILAALEGLKLELLEGRLTAGAMQALTRAVREQRSLTDDPRLEGLLDEIETRAAVELAKFEGSRLAA
ncbi:MAG TPA: flagellar assembly protein FliX [Caulobacteraceae bacterium]|nr:flagellar assembly protein FliX [Caulobacteraceae bacterium]